MECQFTDIENLFKGKQLNLPQKYKFSTVDVLAPISMKNAAKCDKQCELQTVSHWNFERIWHRLVILSVYLLQCIFNQCTIS
jgi:hypothetical protein